MSTHGSSEAGATADLIAMVGSSLDLVSAPFTLPRSRILVLATPGENSAPVTQLRVTRAEYERPLDECIVFEAVSIAGADGMLLPVTGVLPHAIVLFYGSGN